MYTWQPTNLTVDWSDFRKPSTVRAAPLVENVVAEDCLFKMIKQLLGNKPSLRLVFRVRLHYFILKLFDCVVTGPLILRRGIESRSQSLAVLCADLREHLLIQLNWWHFALLDLESLKELLLPTAEAIDLFVSDHQRFHHDLFRNFVGPRFNHHDSFFTSCN